MYSSLQEQRDYDVIRKYQTTRVDNPTKKSPTKKGSYLDDAIRMSSSPGPASIYHIIKINRIFNYHGYNLINN